MRWLTKPSKGKGKSMIRVRLVSNAVDQIFVANDFSVDGDGDLTVRDSDKGVIAVVARGQWVYAMSEWSAENDDS